MFDATYKLDLQLFATQTTLLNAPGNDLSPENKTFYDKNLIRMAKAQLVHDQFGQTRNIPRNGGKTIEFRKFSPLPKALVPLTEGVTPAGNKLNVSSMTAEVSQYGDYIETSDVLDLTAIDNVIVETTELLGTQGGLTLDTITRDILQGGTNVMYAPKVSGGVETAVQYRRDLEPECKLTVDVVKRAATQLKAMNAPKINGKYVAIIHPYAAYDLMSDPEWIDAHKYSAATNIFTGEIGELAGVRFVETTEAKIYSGAGLTEGAVNLTVKTALTEPGSRVNVKEAITDADRVSMIGRKIVIGSHIYTVGSAIVGTAGNAALLVNGIVATADATANATITPGEAGKNGISVFGTLFLGANAYGTTSIDGGGMETIVKQLGSSGTADPLNQRSTIGWKAMKTAERLIEAYILRVESCSAVYTDVPEN